MVASTTTNDMPPPAAKPAIIPAPPHSPTRLSGSFAHHARPRAQSLTSSYMNISGLPLLVPQSPPPGKVHLSNAAASARSQSLSPTLWRRSEGSIPLLSPAMEPPRTSDIQRAVEAAVSVERKRNKELEAQEVDMTADELRAVLKRERQRTSKMASDLARLKTTAVQCQAQAEVMEEGRINGLMRRLESLQMEKGRIINELEREEEMLTNTLQKKLNQVRREKAQLEKTIKDEQLSHSQMLAQIENLRENKGATPPSNAPLGSWAEIPGEEGEEELEEEELEEGENTMEG